MWRAGAVRSGAARAWTGAVRLPGGAARVRLACPAGPVRPRQGRADPLVRYRVAVLRRRARAPGLWRGDRAAPAETIRAAGFSRAGTTFPRCRCVLFFIEHGTRRVHLAGITPREWAARQARNLLMDLGNHADGFKSVIRNWDAKFTAAFDAVLAAVGVRIIKTPVRAPRRTRSRSAGSPAPVVSAWTGG